MKSTRGFTILELVIILASASLLITFLLIQKSNLDAFARDEARKTAINAMYYALEKSFYQDYGYYPSDISPENLPVVNPVLWADPSGYSLGDPLSSYSYESADCDYNGHCQKYTLRAKLEKESTYIKTNNN